MGERNNVEPAFPRDHRYQGHNGMSLRDWFATKAMAAILSTAATGNYDLKQSPNYSEGDAPKKTIAADAYDMADAMLAARSPSDGGM